MSTYKLLLRNDQGTIDLSPGAEKHPDGYRFEVKRGEFSFGNPDPVLVTIERLFRASMVSHSHDENRAPAIPITVTGDDSLALAAGEQALRLLTHRRPFEMVWTPPDGLGPSAVFEVLVGVLSTEFDDVFELRTEAVYQLAMTAAPYVRSVDAVETPAITSGTTTITQTIDTGDSTTSWTPLRCELTTTGGALAANFLNRSTAAYSDVIGIQKATALDLDTTPYVYVDFEWDEIHYTGSELFPRLFLDGIEQTPITSVALPEANRSRYYFLAADTEPSTLLVRVGGITVPGPLASPKDVYTTFAVHHIGATNQAPFSGSRRQKRQTVMVAGSAPTDGSLIVAHPTAALGETAVFVYPDGVIDPDLRRFVTATNGTTADADAVSGFWSDLNQTVVTIPSRLLRHSTYLLFARLRSTLTEVADATVSLSGRDEDPYVLTGVTPGAHTYEIASVTLPDYDVPANSIFNTLLIFLAPTWLQFDELWLYDMADDTALVQVDLGTTAPASDGASNRLELESATLYRDRPVVWRGTQPDGSDKRHAGTAVTSWQPVQMIPPMMRVHTVTANAVDAGTSLVHVPAWGGRPRQ